MTHSAATGPLVFRAILDNEEEFNLMARLYDLIRSQRIVRRPQPIQTYLDAKGGWELMDNGQMRIILKRSKG